VQTDLAIAVGVARLDQNRQVCPSRAWGAPTPQNNSDSGRRSSNVKSITNRRSDSNDNGDSGGGDVKALPTAHARIAADAARGSSV
jgi:hypothetical protein